MTIAHVALAVTAAHDKRQTIMKKDFSLVLGIWKKMKANPFPDRNVVDADEMGPGKAKAGKAKAGN